MRTRKLTVALVMAALGAFLVFDVAQSAPLDRFSAPAVFALGSGQAGAGAHCAALPTAD